MRTDTPRTIHLSDYTPPAFRLTDLNLTFQIFDGHTLVVARSHFTRNGTHAQPLVLAGHDMELTSISLNGAAITPTITDHSLMIASVPDDFTLEIVTKFDPRANTELEGLYYSNGTYCTQCEPEGFRRITYAPDRPDVMSVYTVRIEADRARLPVLLSNGNLVEQGSLPGGRHFAVWHDPFPKPSYLFALVAGDLVHVADTFTTMSGRVVDLRIYVRAGDEGQCAHAMASLKKSMKWDEEVYGREYDLDLFNIVAVSDFNMGAMENKSLNIFNSAYVLAHPDTATDTDFFNVESVVAHEYFHNWTGNRITCRDWFQLSLKEGLTVFRDQEFSADHNARAVCRIDDVTNLRRAQFAEDASPLAHPVRPDSYIEINNFYTMTVYEKGAEVIRMFHTLLGPKDYRRATDLYFSRYDGQAVTCDDFAQCMADASGLDLRQFKLWYAQAGTPHVTIARHFDEKKQQLTVTFTQSIPDTPGQTNKPPMHIPVRFAMFTQAGKPIEVSGGMSEVILNLREATQSFVFEKLAEKPLISAFRGFSAPVKVESDLSADEIHALMRCDTDAFNRWDATQTAIRHTLGGLITAFRTRAAPVLPAAFATAFGTYFDDLGTLPDDNAAAFYARLLMLPDVGTVGQDQDVVDIAAIHKARQFMFSSFGAKHAEACAAFFATFMARYDDAGYQQPGRRALAAVLLKYWAEGSVNGVKAALDLYARAGNMTDRMTALSVLTHTTGPDREAAFADFYGRFKHHELAVNKWFSLQAMSVRNSVLDDILALAAHPDFTLKNPNRARSLWGAFGMNNPVTFHHPSGRGYTMLMDVIIALNVINPSIAARLLTPFREWRRFTPEVQVRMKAELDRLLALPDLSRAVFEIASKSVA